MNKHQKICLSVFFLIVFILGWIFFFADFFESEYKIILDGEEVKEIVKCDDQWNYQNLAEFQNQTLFIPCIWNESLKALFNFNFTISPQENCERFNSTFIGFQVYNDTLAKERYDLVAPKCFEIRDKDIDEEWLNENCECDEYETKKGFKWDIQLYNKIKKDCELEIIKLLEQNKEFYKEFCVPLEKNQLTCQKYKCSENLEIIKS